MSQPTLPNEWREETLKDVVEIHYGEALPARARRDSGNFLVFGSNGSVGKHDKYLVDEPTIIIGRKGSAGEVTLTEGPCWPIDTTFYTTIRGKAHLSCGYLYYFLSAGQLGKLAMTTTVPGVSREDLYDLVFPLPPLPVQERIVEILQKADTIRRKRQDALGLANAILSSTFIAMFGDPGENSRGFKVTPLGELADVRSGVTKGRKLGSKETVEVPYLRVANVQDGFLDLSEINTIKVLPEDLEKYRLEDGDILMTEGGDPDKLGRGCIWRSEVEGCIHQNHVFRVRTDRLFLSPEYLAALLRTQYAKEYFLRCAKRTSNLASINSTQVKALPIPVPPITLQSKFIAAVAQWNQTHRRLTDGLAESKSLFQGLTQQAFTGRLTAAWEAAHADQIAAEQTRREQLPRLVLLDFVRERQRRRPHEPVLITSLMKYVFLLQKERMTGQSLYHFVPYKYGPFAKELYQDLEALVADGFIAVTETNAERTEITSARSNQAFVEEAIAELPDDLQADIAAIVEQYGDLHHNELLAIVYQKFPAYATKSRLRRR